MSKGVNISMSYIIDQLIMAGNVDDVQELENIMKVLKIFKKKKPKNE